jgi:hypothetical protein
MRAGRWCQSKAARKEIKMFDPGAMGTLLIGLNAIRAEEQDDRRRRLVAAARRDHRGIRLALANALRQAAALLEPASVREASNQAAGFRQTVGTR